MIKTSLLKRIKLNKVLIFSGVFVINVFTFNAAHAQENKQAEKTVLSGDANAENTLDKTGNIIPLTSAFAVSKTFNYAAPPMSLTVIRIKTK